MLLIHKEKKKKSTGISKSNCLNPNFRQINLPVEIWRIKCHNLNYNKKKAEEFIVMTRKHIKVEHYLSGMPEPKLYMHKVAARQEVPKEHFLSLSTLYSNNIV